MYHLNVLLYHFKTCKLYHWNLGILYHWNVLLVPLEHVQLVLLGHMLYLNRFYDVVPLDHMKIVPLTCMWYLTTYLQVVPLEERKLVPPSNMLIPEWLVCTCCIFGTVDKFTLVVVLGCNWQLKLLYLHFSVFPSKH